MKARFIQFTLAFVLMLTATLAPAQDYRLPEDSSRAAWSVTADVLLVRPLAFGLTALGTTAFTLALPLTAITGSIDETAESWVRKPARDTFVRCLGCVEVE